MSWGWQQEWALYQDTHPDADWYDFECYYWGDDDASEDVEDEDADIESEVY